MAKKCSKISLCIVFAFSLLFGTLLLYNGINDDADITQDQLDRHVSTNTFFNHKVCSSNFHSFLRMIVVVTSATGSQKLTQHSRSLVLNVLLEKILYTCYIEKITELQSLVNSRRVITESNVAHSCHFHDA